MASNKPKAISFMTHITWTFQEYFPYNCWYAKWLHFVHTFWLFTGVFKNNLVHHCPLWDWCASQHVIGGWFLLFFCLFSMWLVSGDNNHCRVFVVFQTKWHSISKHVALVPTWASDIVSCWLQKLVPVTTATELCQSLVNLSSDWSAEELASVYQQSMQHWAPHE